MGKYTLTILYLCAVTGFCAWFSFAAFQHGDPEVAGVFGLLTLVSIFGVPE